MGSLSHHQAMAQEFLHRADRAISTHDPAEAAAALRRAASHITTALAIYQGWRHKSQRQLETVLQVNISAENLSRSHLKTFRQAHTLPQQMPTAPTHGAPVEPRPKPAHGEQPQVRLRRIEPRAAQPTKPNHPANPAAGPPLEDHPCKTSLRRMRRRVASLIADALRVIAGDPRPVRHHKLWLRRPDFPVAPDFTCIQDILQLPNYGEIRQRFRLFRAPLSAGPDPHGWYARGDIPRRCRCHARLWEQPQDPKHITLSPLWHRALEETFRIKLPSPLQLAC